MRRRLARFLRRIAGSLERKKYLEPPDSHAVALERQTKAIQGLAAAIKRPPAKGVPEAVVGICTAIIGPQIVRSVEETRDSGVEDSEILSVLVDRLKDGWF